MCPITYFPFFLTQTLTPTGAKLYPRKWTRDFDPWPRSADTHLTHRVRSAAPVLRKGRSRHSYAAFAHGYPNEREEDPPPDAEIQAHLPHPKAESLPQIAAIHPNGQRCGEFGQPGIRVSWAESHPPDGHHIHPAPRQILLPLHDPGRLHKAGPGLCDERIAGSGFCFGNGPAAGKAPWDLAEQGDRDPQRPGDPLHQFEVHPAGGEQRTAAVHDRWMDYYNNDRCQWDLAKLSPNEYYHYITTGEYPAGMLPLWVK